MDGDELRRIRETLGYTQTELATALGLRHNTVWRWESGTAPIGHPVMLRLALDRLLDLRRARIVQALEPQCASS